ncbi:MAG: polysaccharide biosynthesis protein [Muribaculaceae bacterium]|nr:polysaccharide biosynthesis protein [Muribaculaceae bacterium]
MAAPTPRWMVLAVDLLFVAIACFITYWLSPTAALNGDHWMLSAWAQGLGVWLVYAICMPVTHAYRYIVRLSVLEDIYRVVELVVLASAFLLLISAGTFFTEGVAYFGVWNIFVVALLVFTMMLCSRLAIKYIYRAIHSSTTKRRRVIALGSNAGSFGFVSTVNNDPNGLYTVVACLTLSPNETPRTVNEVPVLPYDPATVSKIFEHYDSDTLLFSSNQLKFMRSSGTADVFLKSHIHLLLYSLVSEYDEKTGRETTRAGSVRNIKIEDLLGRDVIKPDISEVERTLRDQVVLITGAAGSIGSEIVHQVASLGAKEIVLIDQAETPMHELQLKMESEHPETKIHLFIADVANKERLEQAFIHYQPRYVFHAAAYKHVPMMERNPSEAILTNVLGTKNLADLAEKYNVEKFVMISTDKAVNPTNVMGASKRIAEIYVQSLYFHHRQNSDRPGTKFVTTRFGNVLGSNGSVIPLFRKQIEQGGPVTVTHRDIIRYFMTIPEACSLVLQAGTMGNGGEIYVFDMGQPVKIYDLATRMISLSGLRPGEDIEIIETGLRPGEKLYEELLNDKEMTMATRHNKIMIAKVRVYDYTEVSEHIEALRRFTQAGNYHDIVAEMKRLVPEFKSKNSQWESIDSEIKSEETISEVAHINQPE